MPLIDSHQHFWKYDPVLYDWISEDMSSIRKDFLPEDLKKELETLGIDGCVAVQAQETEQENEWLLEHAGQHNFIRGVVGWLDLWSDRVEERLEYYKGFEKMKGFRNVLQGGEQRDLMLQPPFQRGIGLLNTYGFTYDLLIMPDQLSYARQLVAAFPNQRFVIDHLAKPYIRTGEIKAWEKDLQSIAQYDHVFCKLSGMVTEADWQHWKPAELKPYLDVAVEAFGTDRLLFGSDWPVCLVAGTYEVWWQTIWDYFDEFSEAEQDALFGDNACKFYQL